MIYKMYCFLSGFCTLKNFVKILALTNLAQMARGADCSDSIPNLPLECSLPVRAYTEPRRMISVQQPEQLLATLPIGCAISTDYAGIFGAQYQIWRDSCGSDSALVCDIDADPDCVTEQGSFTDIMTAGKVHHYVLPVYNTTACRQPTFFKVASTGCSYHDDACKSGSDNGSLTIACKNI
jgi:hypothetical protein